MTTSPLAMVVPFAKMSNGSPANLSSSTTEPSFNRSKSLIFISVLPTSTVSLTSIFSRTLKFSELPRSLVSVSATASIFSSVATSS